MFSERQGWVMKSGEERNIKCIVEYEGSRYAGFQDQGVGGPPSIQSELETAIQGLTSEQRRVTGSGRTDAGVHALGQVINFFTASAIPVERWPYALNSVLPDDIVVRSAESVSPWFHSRFSARSKVYRYAIWTERFPSVFWRRYTHLVSVPLAVDRMATAARHLLGTHDFTAFRAAGSAARTSVRTLHRLEIVQDGSLVYITAEADGFLYKMVRLIAGTLLQVGKGKLHPEEVAGILAGTGTEPAGPTAPACGLCLLEVKFP